MHSKAILAAALTAAALMTVGRASAQSTYITPGGARVPGVVIMCFNQANGPDGALEAVPCPDTVLKNSAGQPLGSPLPGTYAPPLIIQASPQFNCGPAVLSKWNPTTGCFNR